MGISNKIDGFYGLPSTIIEDVPMNVHDMQRAKITAELANNTAFLFGGASYPVGTTGIIDNTITPDANVLKLIRYLTFRYPVENKHITCINMAVLASAVFNNQWEICALVCDTNIFTTSAITTTAFNPILSSGFKANTMPSPNDFYPNTDGRFSCVVPITTTLRWHSIKMFFSKPIEKPFDVILFYRQLATTGMYNATFRGASCWPTMEVV